MYKKDYSQNVLIFDHQCLQRVQHTLQYKCIQTQEYLERGVHLLYKEDGLGLEINIVDKS